MFPQGISVQYVTLDGEVSRTNLCETRFEPKSDLGRRAVKAMCPDVSY